MFSTSWFWPPGNPQLPHPRKLGDNPLPIPWGPGRGWGPPPPPPAPGRLLIPPCHGHQAGAHSPCSGIWRENPPSPQPTSWELKDVSSASTTMGNASPAGAVKGGHPHPIPTGTAAPTAAQKASSFSPAPVFIATLRAGMENRSR